MATIGLAHTMSDLRKMLNPDGSIDRVMEVLNESNPIMEDVQWVEGDLPIGNKTTIRASLPTPSIRRINRGTPATKGTVRQIIDVCMNLEDRSCVDVELLTGKPNPEAYRAAEDDAHVEGMGQYVARQLLYGDLDADPDTFNGFFTRYNTLTGDKGTPGYQCISCGTAGTNTNTSILFVDWGDRRVTGIYPKNTTAGLKTQDLGEGDVYDKDGHAYRAVQTLYSMKCGLAVHNVRSVVRACNIDVTKLASMTDAAQKALIDKFIFAKNRLWMPKSPVAYVSEDLYSFLETYLTNKNNVHVTREDIMGAPPKLRFAGIIVKKMDCMVNTEAAVTED
jgi:hypothetical protein